jgi:uncharacterized protein
VAQRPPPPWRLNSASSTLTIRFRLTPKSSKDEIIGVVDTPEGLAVGAKVRAAPEAGAANEALVAVAAKWLEIPKSSVQLTAGSKSRNKTLRLTKASPDTIARLEALLSSSE